MHVTQTEGYQHLLQWMNKNGIQPFPFQLQTWQAIHTKKSGLVNAPTGCGKTYSVFLGAVLQYLNQPQDETTQQGTQLLWITPLKALAKDIARAMQEVITALNIPWQIAIRNGDTGTAERQKQKKKPAQVLIITPESLHLLLAQKGNAAVLKNIKIIAVDEWHELMGSKRGVQVELALSRIIHIANQPSIWGISATIGNLQEAADTLLHSIPQSPVIIKADINKKINIETIMPDEVENYPWAGHLGIKLLPKILPIIKKSTTTLLFINTRGMTEIWYQQILQAAPELAGAMAIHHGSIEQELRIWVEEALHTTKLKLVVCTASLDLGVDFRPVETVIQVGSPKGIARFLQRGGRSGHQPDAESKIYFLPTHSLEILESVALQTAIKEKIIESKPPLYLCYDVLIQYLCTLAVGDGFDASEIYDEVVKTFCYSELTRDEFADIIHYITTGGHALQSYDEYKKLILHADGKYYIAGRKMALQHRLHIGTIVSDNMMRVKMLRGGYQGLIEEYFISKLVPGDVFTLAGKKLELVEINDMTVLVKPSNANKAIVPSWQGGRMSLTANLGTLLRQTIDDAPNSTIPELKALHNLLQLQQAVSHVPNKDELLIELIQNKDGYHLFCYPFEGRMVHEAMAGILAYRLSRLLPISFTIAMNDYGFELLSDQPIPLNEQNVYQLFSEENLLDAINATLNSTEMAKRKFRDVAVIGGLLRQGSPKEKVKMRHLQSSAGLLYKVLLEYDSNNLLLRQSYREVLEQQMEEQRLRDMLRRIQKSKIIITTPSQYTPFCFPLKVDSIREALSSEQLMDRIKKMIASK